VNAIELMGFIGFVAILVLIFSLARARVPSSAGPFGLMLCFTFLGFGATYQLPAWAWMLAGVCLVSNRTQLTGEDSLGIHREKPRIRAEVTLGGGNVISQSPLRGLSYRLGPGDSPASPRPDHP
jgi:hypothetical protein